MRTEYRTLKVELDGGVAVLTLNNPPVNQLSKPFVEEMRMAFEEAFKEDEVKAVVLTGTEKNFIAGADITEIQPFKEKEALLPFVMENNRFLNSIELGPKPVIAAINGNCLGGGLETAMACHYRIAAEGVQIGQPEVQIGLIPGAGGTQRLPRLVGLPDALQMIATGQPISAEEGLKKGCIDEVVPLNSLLPKALEAARRFISGQWSHKDRITRFRKDKLPNFVSKKMILSYARAEAEKKGKGYIAPFKAIEAVERGLSDDFEADLKIEAELFCECAVSDVAKNLIGIFLHTRAAGRLPRIKGIEPQPIQTVAMLGGGTMGSGICNLLLSNGFRTILWDIDEEAIQKGLAAIRKTFDYPIKKGKMSQEERERLMGERLLPTTDLGELAPVDLVIEAVLEDMEIKQGLWKKLEGICRPSVIFGTNTSALPITEMASVLEDPGRMIGLHFFNPAERMQLLEIICGRKTSDQTLATSVAFARAIRKIPIVVNDGPGFYVSRQLGALLGESTFLVGEGVDPAQIEEAVLDFGLPMGPATLGDLTGLDINYHVIKNFERNLGERWTVSPIYERIYQTGCFGRKTGAGWYDYSGEKPVPNPKVLEVIRRYWKEKGIQPKKVSNKEIIERMLARAINEAAYMIEEGICDRPQDMDLAMVYGTGFPPYRGGILRYADSWGIRNVYEHLLKLEREHGVRFKPSALLKEMAEAGRTFYEG
ncbi:MAG: 3-hydroxyacyl-CoA dehydrogenase NAD-binding domain-containing protein [Desulfobacterota bacterium]|nr:3-hydroxyacyl-CoA dehydrogenase NAD-binding domain-containing protein [Thermodesulfobacteriota bacterium]